MLLDESHLTKKVFMWSKYNGNSKWIKHIGDSFDDINLTECFNMKEQCDDLDVSIRLNMLEQSDLGVTI
jgi:hypothetical protein